MTGPDPHNPFGSLPLEYQEALEVLITRDEGPDLEYHFSSKDPAYSSSFGMICNIALDMLCLLEDATIGAIPCRLSEEHRHAMRLVHIEGLDRERAAEEMVLSREELDMLVTEIEQYLIPGEHNVLEGILSLPPLHRRAFIEIFVNGMLPQNIMEKRIRDNLDVLYGQAQLIIRCRHAIPKLPPIYRHALARDSTSGPMFIDIACDTLEILDHCPDVPDESRPFVAEHLNDARGRVEEVLRTLSEEFDHDILVQIELFLNLLVRMEAQEQHLVIAIAIDGRIPEELVDSTDLATVDDVLQSWRNATKKLLAASCK
ncbi:MAG: hypothetical protein O7G85_08490 [Planctomycetota bacterium]|nr:hypothetical protein [Planctomycetota bacterium]